MVELELAQATVNAEAVREVFNVSLQQDGSTNPGTDLRCCFILYVHECVCICLVEVDCRMLGKIVLPFVHAYLFSY